MRNQSTILPILLLTVMLGLNTYLNAQPISIDRGVRAEGLWCFPLVTDSLTYLYLPDRGMLAIDDNKKPQFSFIRYVNAPEDKIEESAHSIIDVGGGAVLHFLVTYDTDEQKIARAESALQQLIPGRNVKIKGPVIFKEGRYALISSILNKETNTEEKKLMSVGAAPVLQGSRIALSFEIDPARSKLLLESMQMPTPDISIVFDMTFSGLMDAYNAKLTVDWAGVHKVLNKSGGVNLYFLSTDLEKSYEEMRQNSSIVLETAGEDEKMQKIVDAAYAKLTDMLFQRINPEQLAPKEQEATGGLMDKLFGSRGMFSSGKIFGFGASAVYKNKNIKTSGSSVLTFNSRASTDRHHYITFNIGDFYKKYGKGEDHIRTVSMVDNDFQNRKISIGIDGSLLPEFDKLINNTTVKLKKVHQDGRVTIDEKNITKELIEKDRDIFLSYDAIGDTDRMEWFNYEYNATFSFRGGKTWETGWIGQNTAMINLLTPYERRTIELEADDATLLGKDVRATTVKIEHPFFDGTKIFETTVRPGDDLSKKTFEITLPAGQYAYKYSIRWQLKNGTVKTVNGQTETGILFIDEVPDK